MKKLDFGGNQVRNNLQDDTGMICVSGGRYSYYLLKSKDSDATFDFQEFESSVCVCLEGTGFGNGVFLNPEYYFFLEHSNWHIQLKSNSLCLLAGVHSKSNKEKMKSPIHKKKQDLKFVNKPWGHEIWITGDNPLFCFKEILIRKSNRTSLQYHEQKNETNLIYSGTARLTYDTKHASGHFDPSTSVLDSIVLTAPSAINTAPFCIHRLEALTDILIFEVSSPETFDVIRIADDSNRSSGTILSEHEQTKWNKAK